MVRPCHPASSSTRWAAASRRGSCTRPPSGPPAAPRSPAVLSLPTRRCYLPAAARRRTAPIDETSMFHKLNHRSCQPGERGQVMTGEPDCYYCIKHRTGQDPPPGGWLVEEADWLVRSEEH